MWVGSPVSPHPDTHHTHELGNYNSSSDYQPCRLRPPTGAETRQLRRSLELNSSSQCRPNCQALRQPTEAPTCLPPALRQSNIIDPCRMRLSSEDSWNQHSTLGSAPTTTSTMPWNNVTSNESRHMQPIRCTWPKVRKSADREPGSQTCILHVRSSGPG